MARTNFTGLNAGELDTLRQLFFNGPTWDGDLVSKQARESLWNQGFVARGADGWNWLTDVGVVHALAIGLGRAKERRRHR